MDTDSTRWLKLKSGSDIRGPENELTDEVVERIGHAFALTLADRLETTPDRLKIAVGRDSSASGKRILAALNRGITAADSDVLDGGLCAMPALFAGVLWPGAEADGAVMVVAARPVQGQNGFKFVTSTGGLDEDDIAALLNRAAATPVPERLVCSTDFTGLYAGHLRRLAARYLEDDALRPLLGMRVVVDARHGAGGFFARFLEELGADTEGSLNLEPDGVALRLDPDPEGPDALAALRREVLENRADLGVAFSVDCDRAAFVDAGGRAVTGNRLIALASALLLEKQPGSTIVTDSVTSSGLSAFIQEWGGRHYRYKRGYRNVIDEAIRLNDEGIDCPLAMETSGHCAFRENSFVDDGVYLALRVICEALDRKREGQSVFSLIDDLQEPVEALELRLPILAADDPDEAAMNVVEVILSHTLEHPEWQLAPDNREGVRITFNLDDGVNNAWFQLRKSVHDPVLALNAESDVPGGIARVLGPLLDLIGGETDLDLAPLRAALCR